MLGLVSVALTLFGFFPTQLSTLKRLRKESSSPLRFSGLFTSKTFVRYLSEGQFFYFFFFFQINLSRVLIVIRSRFGFTLLCTVIGLKKIASQPIRCKVLIKGYSFASVLSRCR